jgi:hypothetical protein
MTTIGVIGQRWRATVTPGGSLDVWDADTLVSWWVAADDRWHVPDHEPTVRQRRIEGTPVVETRVRIPGGDAVQRVHAVADVGGLTVIEVENESSLPVAVAVAGAALQTNRPPAVNPPAGIELPPDAVVLPIGHRATLVIGVAHDGRPAGALPGELPTAAQVVNGWLTVTQRASRLVLPDTALVELVTHERCELLLGALAYADDDPVGFLIGVGELLRMGGDADGWVPEVADAVHRVLRAERGWDAAAALDAAARLLTAAGQGRALRDLQAQRDLVASVALPTIVPDGPRAIAWAERTLAIGPSLFPYGIPTAWWGQHLEAHDLPTGPASSISFALRWHGERPALLWETAGDAVTLTAPAAAPGWSSAERAGETLWPAPTAAAGGTATPTATAPASTFAVDVPGDGPSGPSASFS